MFRDRQFNRAFLISLFCHLVCMYAVCIVITPDNLKEGEVSTVSFLGPILEESAFRVSSAGRPADTLRLYKRPFSLKKDLNPAAEPVELPRRKILETAVNISKNEKPHILLDKIVGDAKEVPFGLSFVRDKGYLNSASLVKEEDRGEDGKKEPFVFQKPFFNREVLYKPPLPKYPQWAEDKGWDFDLELRFRVSPQGRVEFVEPVVSSGSPTIDLLGMRYVRNWQFIPISENKKQWGSVKLNFRLK